MKNNVIQYKLFVRLLILILIIGGTGYFLAGKDWYKCGFLIVFALISIFELINYINNVNRKLAYFFDAVQNEDSTLHFPERVEGRPNQILHKSLNKVNELISNIKIRNEYNERFFRELLKYSSTGIIVVDDDEYVDLINEAALDFLNLKYLAHLRLLKQKQKEVYEGMLKLKPGQTFTVKLLSGEELRQLSVKLATIKFGDKNYNVYSFYDIKAELDENELDSWQKLIRVLTHEIMNSVAPITSLSSTLAKYYSKENIDIPVHEDYKLRTSKTIEGLSVIEETGKGLMHFIDNYRKLTKMPKPSFKTIEIQPWLERIEILMQNEFQEKGIKFRVIHKVSAKKFIADEKLLTQVMINLLKNAVDALNEVQDKKVIIRTSLNKMSRLQIEVIDNGKGIPESDIDQIFIPFFTTRENGSGIGLSLARQIMRLHKGSIHVSSVIGKQTVFRLTF